MANVRFAPAYYLNTVLEQKYNERVDIDQLELLTGTVKGTFDSKKICITISDHYLLMSTDAKTKEVIDELLPILKEVMGGAEPICSYDMATKGVEEKDAMPTIEWDVKDPEGRIKEIVNGRAFSSETKILDLKLYNSKKIEDYLESEQEKEERIKNAKIYGIYPGSIENVEEINNLSEVDLYFAIDALGGHIWRCNHEMAHGRISTVDLTEEKYALEYMVYQTTKFGVEIPEPAIDKHIANTPSYQAWYKFYSNHFKTVLTNEQWENYLQARQDGQDISVFMPSGDWHDLIEKDKQNSLLK